MKIESMSRSTEATREQSSGTEPFYPSRIDGRFPVKQSPDRQTQDGQAPFPPSPAKCFIAGQCDETISGMSREELVSFIRSADLPPVTGGIMERLAFLDRANLQLLAFLTRRCCRNQINLYSQSLGRPAPFLAEI